MSQRWEVRRPSRFAAFYGFAPCGFPGIHMMSEHKQITEEHAMTNPTDEQEREALYVACRSGNFAAMAESLGRWHDCYMKTEAVKDVMRAAVDDGWVDIARTMLDATSGWAGVFVEEGGPWLVPPLIERAVRAGHVEIVRMLIAGQADPATAWAAVVAVGIAIGKADVLTVLVADGFDEREVVQQILRTTFRQSAEALLDAMDRKTLRQTAGIPTTAEPEVTENKRIM
jgi:hypothetical protein